MVQWDISNFGYGQVDKTANREAFTQELETDHTYYTTREVREAFSQKKGTDNIPEKAIAEVKSYDSNIADVFTDEEISIRIQSFAEDYPDDSFEEVVDRAKKDLSDDASHMRAPSGR